MKRRCETAAVKLLRTSASILQVFQLYCNVHCHSLCPREDSGSVTDVGLINDSNVKQTNTGSSFILQLHYMNVTFNKWENPLKSQAIPKSD